MPKSPATLHPRAAVLLEQAERLAAAGAPADAEARFLAAVAVDPGCPARNAYGCFLAQTDRLAEAVEQFSTVLELARISGDDHWRAAGCNNLAAVFRAQGEYASAASLQQQSVAAEAAAVCASSTTAACDLSNLAGDALLAGDLELAERLLRCSLRLEQEQGNRAGEASDWGALGIVLGLRNEFATAVECLGRAYAMHYELHDARGVGADLLNLGEICLRMGRPQTAGRLLLRAAERFRQCGAGRLAEQAVTLLGAARRMAEVRTQSPLLN